MLERCNPQIVEKIHTETRSWRKAAQVLNALYSVSLSHASWRDYAVGKHDIADPETRSRLILPPRPCPHCGRKNAVRKQNKQNRTRTYGYPTQRMQSFLDALNMREALR